MTDLTKSKILYEVHGSSIYEYEITDIDEFTDSSLQNRIIEVFYGSNGYNYSTNLREYNGTFAMYYTSAMSTVLRTLDPKLAVKLAFKEYKSLKDEYKVDHDANSQYGKYIDTYPELFI